MREANLQKINNAKQKKIATDWQVSGAGGLASYNAPAKFRDLFNFTADSEVTHLYTGLEFVFNRVKSFEYDYEVDERLAR